MIVPQNQTQDVKVSFFNLFQFAKGYDYLLMVTGLFGALSMGSLQPIFFILLSRIFDEVDEDEDADDYYDSTVEVAYIMIILGFIFMICAYIAIASFVALGSNMGHHFRRIYFPAVINQDPEWYDLNNAAEVPGSLTSDVLKVERATGDKLVALIFTGTMVIVATIATGYLCTQLGLLSLAFGPLSIIGMMIVNYAMEQSTRAADTSYKRAAGVAEETLQEIKTVAAFNAQEEQAGKYNDTLEESHKSMFKNGLLRGLGMSMVVFSFIAFMGVAFVVAAILIDNGDDNWGDGEQYNAGKSIIAMFISFMVFNNIATLIPAISIVQEGKNAAGRILTLVQTQRKIVDGGEFPKVVGRIEFQDVDFAYPSKPETQILNGLSFNLEAGAYLGVVGSTGSGKSTIIQLLMRFYNQKSGKILIDDIEIHHFNLAHLRGSIGLVSQEPLLFSASIKKNIKYGNLKATDEMIEDAARKAGAWDFIQALPDKLDTPAGSKGSQLSGGQKQRIAIARAIIRKPAILLLDEATSALDKQTEKAVISTIDKNFPDATRIAIAQNLLTIQNSSYIIMLEQGSIIEHGTHDDLMIQEGKYCNLYKLQKTQDYQHTEGNSEDDNQEKQQSALVLQTEEQEEEEEVKQGYLWKRVLATNMQNKLWLYLGMLGSLIEGGSYPFTGMLNGMGLNALATESGDTLLDDSYFICAMLFVVGFTVTCGLLIQAVSYPKMSSNLTIKFRKESFRALLFFDPGYYDLPQNNCSVITTQLNSDCEMISGLSGSIFGILLQIVLSLLVAHIVSAFFSWKISLLVLGCLPLFIIASSSFFMAQMMGFVQHSVEENAAVASDMIINYRSVKAFCLEEKFEKVYMKLSKKSMKETKKKGHKAGISFGTGFSIFFFVFALLFWFGAYQVKEGDIDFEEMLIALFTAMVGADAFFIAGVYMPDIGNGILAAKHLFKILDYQPAIIVDKPDGKQSEIVGNIEFNDVTFQYPQRQYKALKNLSLRISAGQRIAFIGRTGSGKSTIVQLLFRFYDVTSGMLLIDDINIKDYNLKYLRNHMSIVNQEPVLFNGSIASNIGIGIEVSREQIEQVATDAQAMEFVQRYPEGLDTLVGLKGSQLSGGQKQRVAIARALIRNPKILILDEATSALDAKTEKELLKTLEGIMVGRTTIIVAHRLKTISDADYIGVMESGGLIEWGTPTDLYNQKGYFYNVMRENRG